MIDLLQLNVFVQVQDCVFRGKGEKTFGLPWRPKLEKKKNGCTCTRDVEAASCALRKMLVLLDYCVTALALALFHFCSNHL